MPYSLFPQKLLPSWWIHTESHFGGLPGVRSFSWDPQSMTDLERLPVSFCSAFSGHRLWGLSCIACSRFFLRYASLYMTGMQNHAKSIGVACLSVCYTLCATSGANATVHTPRPGTFVLGKAAAEAWIQALYIVYHSLLCALLKLPRISRIRCLPGRLSPQCSWGSSALCCDNSCVFGSSAAHLWKPLILLLLRTQAIGCTELWFSEGTACWMMPFAGLPWTQALTTDHRTASHQQRELLKRTSMELWRVTKLRQAFHFDFNWADQSPKGDSRRACAYGWHRVAQATGAGYGISWKHSGKRCCELYKRTQYAIIIDNPICNILYRV